MSHVGCDAHHSEMRQLPPVTILPTLRPRPLGVHGMPVLCDMRRATSATSG